MRGVFSKSVCAKEEWNHPSSANNVFHNNNHVLFASYLSLSTSLCHILLLLQTISDKPLHQVTDKSVDFNGKWLNHGFVRNGRMCVPVLFSTAYLSHKLSIRLLPFPALKSDKWVRPFCHIAVKLEVAMTWKDTWGHEHSFQWSFFFQFAGFQIFSAFPAPDSFSLCYRYVMYVLYGLRQVPISTKAPTPNF